MSRDDTLRETLQSRIHRLVVDLWADEDAARDFSDPEGVHRMRVASRKLRAALDTGDRVFDRKPERRLRKGVRNLARALGAVRDGDVMIATLGETTPDRPGVQRLIDRLEHQRDVDRKRLLALLDEMDANGFRKTSLAMFTPGTGAKRRKIRKRDARALVARPRAGFATISREIPDENDIEGLHRLRIAAKRLRYVLQLVEPALTPDSTRALDPLGTMQDMLGDIHNDDVLIALVRDELHALVERSIESAMGGGPASDPTLTTAWDDLVSLLAETARDRHARYTEFAAWWEDLRRTGVDETIATVGTPRGRR